MNTVNFHIFSYRIIAYKRPFTFLDKATGQLKLEDEVAENTKQKIRAILRCGLENVFSVLSIFLIH